MGLAWDYGSHPLLSRYNSIFFFLALFFCCGKTFSVEDYFKKSNKIIVQDYLKLLNKYSKLHCPGGTEEKFNKLYQKFKVGEFFIPTIDENELDKKAIEENLNYFKLKMEWIKKERGKLLSLKSYKSIRKDIISLKLIVRKILELKERGESPENLLKISNLLVKFKARYFDFIEKITFFTSFTYPTDLLELRLEYDRFKGEKSRESQMKANSIYFYRKLVEDGSFDKNKRRSDKGLRLVLDTLGVKITQKADFFDEDFRYDLEYVFDKVDRFLAFGKKKWTYRFNSWERRVQKGHLFYSQLLNGKVLNGEKVTSPLELIDSKFKARYQLRNYIHQKLSNSYLFWEKQNDLMKMLFSIETILYNEVGGVDNSEGTERKDIIKILKNRVNLPEYSTISAEDPLHKYISTNPEAITKNPWLNILFKEGEFSFTYFFIHGSVRVFCPSKTRRSKMLRVKNLHLGLNELRKKENNFTAVRYYSRASMTGRVRMDIPWSDFEAVKERPGPRIFRDRRYRGLYLKKRYEFLYEFLDPLGERYKVVRLARKVVVLAKKNKRVLFFKYRNPHHFRYFSKRDVE